MNAPSSPEDAVLLLRGVLEALQDPEGHIWHGDSGECTGECREIQEALRLTRNVCQLPEKNGKL